MGSNLRAAVGGIRSFVAGLMLAPWAILILAGGGIHTHTVLIAHRDGMVQSSTTSVQACTPDVRDPNASCAACQWWLQSVASPGTLSGTISWSPAGRRLSVAFLAPVSDSARSFDPRAPPLS